ncbi:MAG: hypothetical protein V3S41_02485, partial [Spirochaetia bacterium]
IVPASVLADEVDLTPDQMKIFSTRRLSVEVGGMMYAGGSVSPTGGVTVSGSSWTIWTPYEGFRKISESEFFEVAGYPDEAAEAAEFRKTSFIIWGSGLGALTVSLLLLPLALNGNTGAFALQMIMMAGGATAALLGGLRIGKNWAPVDMAIDIADVHNQDIVRSIAEDGRK